MQQEKALAILKSGRNVFLTGSAGTGKTFVLNKYIQYLKERKIPVAVTASTGIAATHMNGQTIHSWCGMGVKDSIHQVDLRKLGEKKYIQKNVQNARVLIIDEISMLHKNQLQMVDEILIHLKSSFEAFGGLQVVLSGDFFQLPPVTKNEETNREKFAFMSKSWVDARLTVCYLTEQFRQTDNELNDVLNQIRKNDVSVESMAILDEAVYNKFKEEPTRLYSHNYDVDRVNLIEIETLAGEEEIFPATVKGNQGLKEMLTKSVLAPDNLILKENARVMFVKNNYEKGYMNGTLGSVTAFDPDTGFPIVKLSTGKEIIAEPEVWSVDDESGKTLASFTQIPLRLAWAITVHKSQGMTLEAAEVDLTKTFEPGQGYVALSRLKNIDGLRLLGYNEISLQVDGLALKADNRFQELSAHAEKTIDFKTIGQSQIDFIKHCGGITDPEEIKKQANKTKAKKSKVSTQDQTKALFEAGETLKAIADERGLTTGTVVSHLVSLRAQGIELNYSRLKPALKGIEEMEAALTEIESRDNAEDFLENGIVRSKVLFDQLKGKYSYEKINLFKLFQ
ncbi:MAG: ATP-dependent exoDNAse (exonuclease V) alpha subunit [Bacteroidia bacterium]|jgi:ATP-dependent exoDNAse (exonuclease V) alpha subunit